MTEIQSICRANELSERYVITKNIPVSIPLEELIGSLRRKFYDDLNEHKGPAKFGPLSYLFIKDNTVYRKHFKSGRWEESEYRQMTKDQTRIYNSIQAIEKWLGDND